MTFKIHYKAPVMKTLYICMSWHKDGAARMSIRPTHAESADVWQRLNNCSAKKSSNLLDPSNSCAAFCCNDKQSQGRGSSQATGDWYLLYAASPYSPNVPSSCHPTHRGESFSGVTKELSDWKFLYSCVNSSTERQRTTKVIERVQMWGNKRMNFF